MSLQACRHHSLLHAAGETDPDSRQAFWVPGVFDADTADIALIVSDVNCR